MAEQFRFEQLAREGRAAHRDERLGGSRAQAVDFAGDEGFAGAAFAGQQEGDVELSGLFHLPEQLAHAVAAALFQATVLAAGSGRPAHRLGDGLAAAGAAGIQNHAEQPLQIKRLGQVVVRTRPERAHGGFRFVHSGEHDHRHLGTERPQAGQNLDAVRVRQAMVQHHRLDGGTEEPAPFSP